MITTLSFKSLGHTLWLGNSSSFRLVRATMTSFMATSAGLRNNTRITYGSRTTEFDGSTYASEQEAEEQEAFIAALGIKW